MQKIPFIVDCGDVHIQRFFAIDVNISIIALSPRCCCSGKLHVSLGTHNVHSVFADDPMW